MRSIQRKESKAWKEKHEEICRILEPNSGYLDCEIERAKRTLLDMEDHELAGKFIRSKAKDISLKSQMTKHHFAKAKKEHETTITWNGKEPPNSQTCRIMDSWRGKLVPSRDYWLPIL